LLFGRAAIAGVGLIGGSLALAARAAGLIGEVVGIGRSEANLATALRRGCVDRIARDPADIGAIDLLVLAVPVRSTGAVAVSLLPHLPPGTVVSDVGSVKGRRSSMRWKRCCQAIGRSSARIRSPAAKRAAPPRRRQICSPARAAC
jgi:prephenate dehydrogenase